MTIPTMQYAFVAGEVSPEFYGRSDLVKYGLGAALVRNYYVGFRGGLYSRAGFRFAGDKQHVDDGMKLHRFKATGDDYVLLFGDLTMRVLRSGGYLLEATKVITAITSADPAVVTSAAHSYTTSDMVYLTGVVGTTELNGRYFEVGATTANTFEILDVRGNNIDSTALTAYVSDGTAARVYTLTTTYAEADLADLAFEQGTGGKATLTHQNYKPRELTYVSDTNWTLTEIVFGNDVGVPQNLALAPSSAATAGVAFSVSAVIDDVEGLASDYELTELTVDYATTAGSMKVTWDAVGGADWYNVYRTLILPTGADISLSQEVGYVGRALSTQFIDNNILSDFTKTPPLALNPFANGAITEIEVTAGGTGYAKSDTVTVVGAPGTGFSGYPVVDAAGAVLSIVIINGGEGYVAPVVSVVTGGGSGATAVATVGLSTGNNPKVYRRFQQRGVYAGTVNFPMTIWGSKPGVVNNFDVSVTLNDGDAYSFQLDEAAVKPIEHLIALRTGLLAFTDVAVTQLRAQEGSALTPLNAFAEPQAYKGIGSAPPLAIDLDVLFVQTLSTAVNAMLYTEYTNSFKLQNLATLSHHLMGTDKEITRMEFVAEPEKLVYCLREDGTLLTLTYDRNEEVFGWARQATQGYFKDCVAVLEGNTWSLYCIVERLINGSWVQYVEVIKPRDQELIEDFWCADAAVQYPLTEPAATLSLSGVTGTGIAVTASASVFTSGNVGDILYVGGGKLEVTAYTGGTEITCTALRDVIDVIPERDTATARKYLSGEWSIATPTTTVGGLWHLEGEAVSVLADGDAFLDVAVSGGEITLDNAATKIVAGLQYKCRGRTLSAVSSQALLEGARNNVLGIAATLHKTRGLAFGDSFDNLREVKDRSDEDWGEAINERSGTVYEELEYEWKRDGTIYFEQRYPLPATILRIRKEIDEGSI